MNIDALITGANPVSDDSLAGPDSLEARRIYNEITGSADSGRSTRKHHPARRRVRYGLVVAAAAAAVLGFVVAGVPGSPTRPQPAAAAAVLTKAAAAAAAQPPLPGLASGQYYYEERIESGPCLATDQPASPPTPTYYDDEALQTWVTTNGSGESRSSPTPTAHFLSPAAQAAAGGTPPPGCGGTSDQTIPANTDDAGVMSLPTNPSTLAGLFAQGRVNDIGQVTPSATTCPSQAGDAPEIAPTVDVCSVPAQFDIAVNLLTFPTAPERLGAVLYGILAKLPGVVVIGTQTDALGRTGTAIEDPSSGQVFVLDPSNGVLLESEMLATASHFVGLAPGSLVSAMTYGPVSIVSRLGTLPG